MQLVSAFFVFLFVVSTESSLTEEQLTKLRLSFDDKCIEEKKINVADIDVKLQNCKGEFDDQITKLNFEDICGNPGNDLCASVIGRELESCLKLAEKDVVDQRVKVIGAELKHACDNKEEFKNYIECVKTNKVTESTSECKDFAVKLSEVKEEDRNSDHKCELVINLDSCEAERLKSCGGDAMVKFLNETTKSGLRQTPCVKFLPNGGSIGDLNLVVGIVAGSIQFALYFI